MFFASCANEFDDYGGPDRKGYGSCDIFYAQKINGRWTKPRNAGSAVNTNQWETQPSFSSDGKTLYFIRGIRGRSGIKEQDIFMSTIGDDGRFSTAVKISSLINTPMKEESVFIHPDNQTLYFSSAGHPGMGGLDIFMSRRQPDGSWGEAINLGYPINTYATDNGWELPGSVADDPSGFENDKMMRNRGYMKGPACYKIITQGWTTGQNARYSNAILRRILGQFTFDKAGSHLLTVKGLSGGEFMFDYMEFVPTNALESEDIY